MAIQHCLWPLDYTGIVILKVATRYHFFKEGKENALAIFNEFFNSVMRYNAENCFKKAPMDYDLAEKFAKNALLAYRVSTEPPTRGDLHEISPGQQKVDS